MELQITEVQELIDSIGEVFEARQKELDLANEPEDDDGSHASPELMEAQAETTKKLDAFKELVAGKIQGAGIRLMKPVATGQAAVQSTGDAVTVPDSIGCDCAS